MVINFSDQCCFVEQNKFLDLGALPHHSWSPTQRREPNPSEHLSLLCNLDVAFTTKGFNENYLTTIFLGIWGSHSCLFFNFRGVQHYKPLHSLPHGTSLPCNSVEIGVISFNENQLANANHLLPNLYLCLGNMCTNMLFDTNNEYLF